MVGCFSCTRSSCYEDKEQVEYWSGSGAHQVNMTEEDLLPNEDGQAQLSERA